MAQDGKRNSSRLPGGDDSDDRARIDEQHELAVGELRGHEVLDSVVDAVLVLNGDRRIVYANRRVLGLARSSDKCQLLGERVGDMLGCGHAAQAEHGCGTTPFCMECGAFRAIQDSLAGEVGQQECRVAGVDGGAFDLRVRTVPMRIADEAYSLVSMSDIADEKRRQALERIFYHDVLNTAGALVGFAQLLSRQGSLPRPEMLERVKVLSTRLVGEIEMQRDLAYAESGELEVKIASFDMAGLAAEMVAGMQAHPLAADRVLLLAEPAVQAELASDRRLCFRVVENMVKNALEASEAGETVTVGVVRSDEATEIWVHNPGVMPATVQRQVFKRSFSTKGTGRGLGTYSMKLLSERYLGGTVGFASSVATGTRFSLRVPNRPSSE